jgi:hypothetical protein
VTCDICYAGIAAVRIPERISMEWVCPDHLTSVYSVAYMLCIDGINARLDTAVLELVDMRVGSGGSGKYARCCLHISGARSEQNSHIVIVILLPRLVCRSPSPARQYGTTPPLFYPTNFAIVVYIPHN